MESRVDSHRYRRRASSPTSTLPPTVHTQGKGQEYGVFRGGSKEIVERHRSVQVSPGVSGVGPTSGTLPKSGVSLTRGTPVLTRVFYRSLTRPGVLFFCVGNSRVTSMSS